MNYKKLIPSIFIRGTQATVWFNDTETISEDIPGLAEEYYEHGADEFLIFEMSERDDDHEKALAMMGQICASCHIPVNAGGNLKNLDEVRNLLEHGAQKIIFDIMDVSKRSLLRDTYRKLGKEKVAVLVEDFDSLFKNIKMIEEYSSEIVFRNPVDLASVENMTDLPCIIISDSENEEELIEMLGHQAILGLSGRFVSRPHGDLEGFKDRCMEEDIQMSALLATMDFSQFKLDSNGMIPVVVQDYKNLEVLMVAYMNQEAYEHTIRTGIMTYWSRSRDELWIKGDTSGHYQYVKSLAIDCDNDTILAKVDQVGAACHTGSRSCFYTPLAGKDPEEENPTKVFDKVFNKILDSMSENAGDTYETLLALGGTDAVLKKYSETVMDLLLAAHKNRDGNISEELGRSLYHLMIIMANKGYSLTEILELLENK